MYTAYLYLLSVVVKDGQNLRTANVDKKNYSVG